jgi:peptidoglycan/LPS O-acetylase OafA/YrhL
MSKFLTYRPDIDGIRALAVLLVFFFHAKFSAISGGFIGVDVFFVLSGFLISLNIIKDVKEGKFSYRRFYLRRIKRLAPALVVLLVLTTIPAYFILFSDDFELFSRNLIHAFLSTSNFFLWSNTAGYFSPRIDFFPLLHTWSLAVEEQFYFIWPALLIMFYTHTKAKQLEKLLFILLISLFCLSIYLANYNPSFAYFLLPARAFELMMGAIVAVIYHKIPKLKPFTAHALSLAGLTLILMPAFIISKQDIFPGVNAFYPCLGTVLLLITGKDLAARGIVNEVISHRSFAFVGLISYSLYLWHWPIFIYIQYLGLELSGVIRIAAMLLSFILAFLSWRFVEQPVRHMNLPNLSSSMKKIVLPSFVILTTIYAVIDIKNGFPERFNELAEFDKKNNFPSTVRKKCFDAGLIGNVDQCWLGIKKDSIDGMLIGDSFANHSASFIDVLAKDAGLLIHDSSSGGHPILTRLTAENTYDLPPVYAEERLDYALQFEHIILATNWDTYKSPENINYEWLLKTIEKITKHDIKVSVIISLPATTRKHLHQLKLAKTSPIISVEKKDASLSKPIFLESHIVLEMKRRYPNINYIDLRDVMCKDSRCAMTVNDTIVYRNPNHLNTSGAAMIGEKYLSILGNPFK